MKRALMVAAALVAAVLFGMVLQAWLGGDNGGNGSQTTGGEREILYWVAPMDPNYRRDEPGKSPMGMDLIPVYADEASAAQDSVTISPTVQHNLGVRTAVAEQGPLWRMVRATGYVGLDESRIAHIHLRTEGWVEQLAVDTAGERVRAGAVVAEVYSPQLVNAQKEYLNARGRGNQALAGAAEEKLRALGMTGADVEALRQRGAPSQTFRVTAPQDGVVVELNVREGMYVMPATILMSIADLSSVWVHAEVFESQSQWVAVGQPAEMRLDYAPGEVFEGEVEFIDPILDSMTRTLNVRLRFDNPGLALKPNMFAAVRIFGGPKRDVLSVPAEAVIRGATTDRVVVALGDGRFQSREVETGIHSGDWVEIRRGVEAGERVVTSAQFLIDSEASLAGSLLRLGAMNEDAAPVEPDAGPWVVAGRVVAVTDGALTIEHDPVEALGWPAMTMDFGLVSPDVAQDVVAGDAIHFYIEQADSGSYVIREIHNMGGGDRDEP